MVVTISLITKRPKFLKLLGFKDKQHIISLTDNVFSLSTPSKNFTVDSVRVDNHEPFPSYFTSFTRYDK